MKGQGVSTTVANTSAAAERRGITVLLAIAATAALVIALYKTSFASIVEMWQYSDFRHGAIVFPISAYLLWRSREHLAAAELRPCAWGLAIVGVLIFAWLVARAVGLQAAEHLAVVLLIPAATLTFLGEAVARRAMFPLLFLIAAVPVGDTLIPFLMQITADVSAAFLQLFGVPVFRQGQFLSLPGGDFEVADICAGLRYLTAGTVIALLFAYLTYTSNVKRFAFVAATAIAMIVANSVRAFIVMYVASASGMRYLAGQDHVYFGWLLFGLVLLGLIYVGGRFADRAGARPPAAGRTDVSRPRSSWPLVAALALGMLAATAQPLEDVTGGSWVLIVLTGGLLLWALYSQLRSGSATQERSEGSVPAYRGARASVVWLLAPVLLAAGPFLAAAARPSARVVEPAAALPPVAGCVARPEWTANWRPKLQSPDFELAATYDCSATPINVLIAGYLDNTQSRELVGDGNRLTPDDSRQFTVIGKWQFTAADGRKVDVNELRIDGPTHRSLTWYWYTAGGHTTTAATVVKLRQALQLLTDGRSDGGVHLLTTPSSDSLEESRLRLASVARELAVVPLFDEHDQRAP